VRPPVTPHPRQPVLDSPSTHCVHATDPTGRPDCELTAVIRFGNVALCAACQQRRSSVGKGQRPVALATGPTISILGWITTAHQQVADADQALRAAVTRARRSGHSWTAIGTQLSISRQAAQQRFTEPRRRT